MVWRSVEIIISRGTNTRTHVPIFFNDHVVEGKNIENIQILQVLKYFHMNP